MPGGEVIRKIIKKRQLSGCSDKDSPSEQWSLGHCCMQSIAECLREVCCHGAYYTDGNTMFLAGLETVPVLT